MNKPCFYYSVRGYCKFGDDCKYKHPENIKVIICKKWKNKGKCKFGSNCYYKFTHIPQNYKNYDEKTTCDFKNCTTSVSLHLPGFRFCGKHAPLMKKIHSETHQFEKIKQLTSSEKKDPQKLINIQKLIETELQNRKDLAKLLKDHAFKKYTDYGHTKRKKLLKELLSNVHTELNKFFK